MQSTACLTEANSSCTCMSQIWLATGTVEECVSPFSTTALEFRQAYGKIYLRRFTQQKGSLGPDLVCGSRAASSKSTRARYTSSALIVPDAAARRFQSSYRLSKC